MWCLMHLPSACTVFLYEYRFEFWWKSIDFGIVFVAFTFGVLIFSYQELRQLHVCRSLIMRFRRFWRIEENDQNQRKSLFYFSELRGRGKSSARISKVKSTYLRILFFLRSLKMRLRHASSRNFQKKFRSRCTNRKKPYQKNGLFWKFQKINDDVKATQSIFLGMNFGGAAWPGAAWLLAAGCWPGWLACRLIFLDLIVKVIIKQIWYTRIHLQFTSSTL